SLRVTGPDPGKRPSIPVTGPRSRRSAILRPGVHSWSRIVPMPIDIALTSLAMPLAEFAPLAREAEARGYRTAWVGEASGAEAIVLSTLIATHTATLQIANGVIPVQTRTPIVYGQAAATLAHLAP